MSIFLDLSYLNPFVFSVSHIICILSVSVETRPRQHFDYNGTLKLTFTQLLELVRHGDSLPIFAETPGNSDRFPFSTNNY